MPIKLVNVACVFLFTYILMFCFFWMIDHQPSGLCFPVSFSSCHILSVLSFVLASFSFFAPLHHNIRSHSCLCLIQAPSHLTSPLSPSTCMLFVLGLHYPSSLLILSILVLNCRTILLTSCLLFFLTPPFQTNYHLTLCSPSMIPGCPWWII